MISPHQKIEASDGSHHLLISIYDLPKLKINETQEIIRIFKEMFSSLPIDFMAMIINVTPLDKQLNSYVIFLKLEDSTAIYSTAIGVSLSIVATLKGFLKAFVAKLNDNINTIDISEYDSDDLPEEIKGESYSNDLGFISGTVNVDDILREFQEEEKRKKEKGQ